MLDVGIIIQF